MRDGMWEQESGEVDADARYIRQLPTLAMRSKEFQRLGRVHGQGYRWNVERAVAESWPDADGRLAPLEYERYENPRAAALSAVGGKGG